MKFIVSSKDKYFDIFRREARAIPIVISDFLLNSHHVCETKYRDKRHIPKKYLRLMNFGFTTIEHLSEKINRRFRGKYDLSLNFFFD